jgi:hypothetical protein
MRMRRLHGTALIAVIALLGGAACGSDADPAADGGLPPNSSPQDTGADGVPGTTGGSRPGGIAPCDLVTEAEMTDLFGAPVESAEIRYESVDIGVQCQWNLVGESVDADGTLPDQYVLVQPFTGEYDLGQLHQRIDAGGIEGLSELVPDIGDGAILIAGGEGILVAVGDLGFALRIAVDPDPSPATVEALARAAVDRMPA